VPLWKSPVSQSSIGLYFTERDTIVDEMGEERRKES
jgi:hypothetical protein